jgi:chromosome segregation ATPase
MNIFTTSQINEASKWEDGSQPGDKWVPLKDYKRELKAERDRLKEEYASYKDAAESAYQAQEDCNAKLRDLHDDLERGLSQTIDERDEAQDCIDKLLDIAGVEHEWSNLFGFYEACDLFDSEINTLRARHAALVEAVVRLENEWDADWPMPYCLVEFLESSEVAKLKATLAEVK